MEENVNDMVDKICNEQNYDDILRSIIKSNNNNKVQKLLYEIENDKNIPEKIKQKAYEAIFDHINYSNNEVIKNIKQIFRKGVEKGINIITLKEDEYEE